MTVAEATEWARTAQVGDHFPDPEDALPAVIDAARDVLMVRGLRLRYRDFGWEVDHFRGEAP